MTEAILDRINLGQSYARGKDDTVVEPKPLVSRRSRESDFAPQLDRPSLRRRWARRDGHQSDVDDPR